MKRIWKWLALVFLVLLIAGFTAFLYLIPPLTLISPESLSNAEASAAPSMDGIPDPGERAIAERGRYLVLTTGCTGCHTPPGDDNAPNNERYLAGGIKIMERTAGTLYTRNLTPDQETGLGRFSALEIAYRLRTGQTHEGRILVPTVMPWPVFSNWTDEDRYAVAVYLKHLKPVRSVLPPLSRGYEIPDTMAREAMVNRDFGGR